MSLEGAKLICLDEAGNYGAIVMAKGRKFTLGYYVSCDFVLVDERARGVHCEIECDAFGRVTIRNLSPDKPILVNGSTVEIKRILLNNSRLSILDKEYLWLFPKCSNNEFEDLTSDDAYTPQKYIGIPEQPPKSCPDFKLHRELHKRFTIDNFAYFIQSDEERNTSLDSNDTNITEQTSSSNENKNDDKEIEQNDRVKEKKDNSYTKDNRNRSLTPELKDGRQAWTPLLETPKMDLIHSTKDKENKSTEKKNKQLLMVCHQSDMVITSFSPRETGVKIEKSFATIVKPKLLLTKPPTTPKSVYSTPRGESIEIEKEDLSTYHTPSTSKAAKVLKNSSMHLIDLITPNKLRPASPHLKSTLKASTKRNLSQSVDKFSNKLSSEEQLSINTLPLTPVINDNNNSPLETPISIISVSSAEISSVIEVTSDGSNMDITPVSSTELTTPSKSKSISSGVSTPKKTPQSLMKRAILTSAKKQITTPQRSTNNPAKPRKESINRIPLRNNLLQTPSTPQDSVGDKNIFQLHRRRSMSTPTRKCISAQNRFDRSLISNLASTSSPSTSSTTLSRRSSLNQISVVKSLPTSTSTPTASSSNNIELRNRFAFKKSPLHKIRKPIVLSASASKITSVKEKSVQQVMSNRLVCWARKSLRISPISVRSRNMVITARTPPQTTCSSSILMEGAQSSRESINDQKAILFPSKGPEHAEIDDLNCTFVIDSDKESENSDDKKKNSKRKDATFSPEKDKTSSLVNIQAQDEVSVSRKEQTAAEIPVDVDEIAELTKENQKYQNKENVNESLEHKCKSIIEGNIVEFNEQVETNELNDNTRVCSNEKSIVTEESFGEIINNSPDENPEKDNLSKCTEITENPEEFSQTEETVDQNVTTSKNLSEDKNDKTEILETGFGEESNVETIDITNIENVEGTVLLTKNDTENKTSDKSSFGEKSPEIREISKNYNVQVNSIIEKNDIENEVPKKSAFEMGSTVDVIEASRIDNIKDESVYLKNLVKNDISNIFETDNNTEGEKNQCDVEKDTPQTEFVLQTLLKPNVVEMETIKEEITSKIVESVMKNKEEQNTLEMETISQNPSVSKDGFKILDIGTANFIKEFKDEEKHCNEYKPICEDITLEGSLIENDLADVENSDVNKSTLKGSVIDENVKSEENLENIKIISKESIEESPNDNIEIEIREKNNPDKNVETEKMKEVEVSSTQEMNNINKETKNVPNFGEKCQSVDIILKGKVEQSVDNKSEIKTCEVYQSKIEDDFENTSKLLEEIEDVLNKSDEIKQKYLTELDEDGHNNKPSTQEFKREKLNQADNLSPSVGDGEKITSNNDVEINKCAIKIEHVSVSNSTEIEVTVEPEFNSYKENINDQTNLNIQTLNQENIGGKIEDKLHTQSSNQTNSETVTHHQKQIVGTNINDENISNQKQQTETHEKENTVNCENKIDNLLSEGFNEKEIESPKGKEQDENDFKNQENLKEDDDLHQTRPIQKIMDNSSNRTPRRRSTRLASQSTDIQHVAIETSFTPRRSARRASMSTEITNSHTPTKKSTRRASFSAINETNLTPKRITGRRASMSIDDEDNKPITSSKTPRAKIGRKLMEQRMVIAEEMNEVIGSTILEENEDTSVENNLCIKKANEKEDLTTEIENSKQSDIESEPTLEREIVTTTESLLTEKSQVYIDSEAQTGTKAEVSEKPESALEEQVGIVESSDNDIKKLEGIPSIAYNLNLTQSSLSDNKGLTDMQDEILNECKAKSSTNEYQISKDLNKDILCRADVAEIPFEVSKNTGESLTNKDIALPTKTSEAEINTSKCRHNETETLSNTAVLLKTSKKGSEHVPSFAIEQEMSTLNVKKSIEFVDELLETPQIDVTKEEIEECEEKEIKKLDDHSPQVPILKGMCELLEIPKTEINVPKLVEIRNSVQTPKIKSENEQEKEKLSVAANLVKTLQVSQDFKEIIEETPSTSTKNANLERVEELPKTSKTCSVSQRFKGMSEPMQIPKINSTAEMEDMQEINNSLNTKEKNQLEASVIKLKTSENFEENIENISLKGVKELLKTPKISDTSRFKGMDELMKTPKTTSTPILTDVKELIDTPAVQKESELEKASFSVIEKSYSEEDGNVMKEMATTSKNLNLELLKTPKSSSTPYLREAVRELMQTPKMCSTPFMGGLKELLESPSQQKEKELDKFLKTPSAKNIMIPTMPSSAVIEKNKNFIEISTEYDLNATNIRETSNLEDLFKTSMTSHFVEDIKPSYYEEERMKNEPVEEINNIKNETLEDTLNKSAEDAFDKLIGQETQIHTPVRKIYNRKSCGLKTPQNQSPFTAADVLSDLPKTDVEKWIETLGEAEPPTIREYEDDEVEEVSHNESLKKEQSEVSVGEENTLHVTADDSFIPESCTKVYLSENNVKNVSKISVTSVRSKDPLETTASKLKEKDTRPVTPIEAEISGINLLDQTVESVQYSELSMLDEPLRVDDPSVLEEPLVVSDNETETSDTLSNADGNDVNAKEEYITLEVSEEYVNELSEPLLLSDSEDLNQSQEIEQSIIVSSMNNIDSKQDNTSINYKNNGEKSILENVSCLDVTAKEDPLEVKNITEQESSIMVIGGENESANRNVTNIEDEGLVRKPQSSLTEEYENNLEKMSDNKNIKADISNIDHTNDNLIHKEIKSDVLETENLENTKILSINEEKYDELNVSENKEFSLENAEEDIKTHDDIFETMKEAVEISIEETNVKSKKTEDKDIFIDTSVTEMFEETNISNVDNVKIIDDIESKKSSEERFKNNECENIFMDSCVNEISHIDESFANEATNEENDVENEIAMVEITTKAVPINCSENDSSSDRQVIEEDVNISNNGDNIIDKDNNPVIKICAENLNEETDTNAKDHEVENKKAENKEDEDLIKATEEAKNISQMELKTKIKDTENENLENQHELQINSANDEKLKKLEKSKEMIDSSKQISHNTETESNANITLNEIKSEFENKNSITEKQTLTIPADISVVKKKSEEDVLTTTDKQALHKDDNNSTDIDIDKIIPNISLPSEDNEKPATSSPHILPTQLSVVINSVENKDSFEVISSGQRDNKVEIESMVDCVSTENESITEEVSTTSDETGVQHIQKSIIKIDEFEAIENVKEKSVFVPKMINRTDDIPITNDENATEEKNEVNTVSGAIEMLTDSTLVPEKSSSKINALHSLEMELKTENIEDSVHSESKKLENSKEQSQYIKDKINNKDLFRASENCNFYTEYSKNKNSPSVLLISDEVSLTSNVACLSEEESTITDFAKNISDKKDPSLIKEEALPTSELKKVKICKGQSLSITTAEEELESFEDISSTSCKELNTPFKYCTENTTEIVKSYNFEVKINDLDQQNEKLCKNKYSQSNETCIAIEVPTTTTRKDTKTKDIEGIDIIEFAASVSSLGSVQERSEKLEENRIEIQEIEAVQIEENESKCVRISRRKRTAVEEKNSDTSENRFKLIRKAIDDKLEEKAENSQSNRIEIINNDPMKDVAKLSRKRTVSQSSQDSVKDGESQTSIRRTRRKVQKTPVEKTVTEQEENERSESSSSLDEQKTGVKKIAIEKNKEVSVGKLEENKELPVLLSKDENQSSDILKNTQTQVENTVTEKIKDSHEYSTKKQEKVKQVNDEKQIANISKETTPKEGNNAKQSDDIEMLPNDFPAVNKEKIKKIPIENTGEVHITSTINVELNSDIQESPIVDREDNLSSILNADLREENTQDIVAKSVANLEQILNQPSEQDSKETHAVKIDEKLQKEKSSGYTSLHQGDKSEQTSSKDTVQNSLTEAVVEKHEEENVQLSTETCEQEMVVEEPETSSAIKETEKHTNVEIDVDEKQVKLSDINEITELKDNIEIVGKNDQDIKIETNEKPINQFLHIDKRTEHKLNNCRRKPTVSESSQDSIHEDNISRSKRTRRKIQKPTLEEIVVEESLYYDKITTTKEDETTSDKFQRNESVVNSEVFKHIEKVESKLSDEETVEVQTVTIDEIKEKKFKIKRHKTTTSETSHSSVHDNDTLHYRKTRCRVQKSPLEKVVLEGNEKQLTTSVDNSENKSVKIPTEVKETKENIPTKSNEIELQTTGDKLTSNKEENLEVIDNESERDSIPVTKLKEFELQEKKQCPEDNATKILEYQEAEIEKGKCTEAEELKMVNTRRGRYKVVSTDPVLEEPSTSLKSRRKLREALLEVSNISTKSKSESQSLSTKIAAETKDDIIPSTNETDKKIVAIEVKQIPKRTRRHGVATPEVFERNQSVNIQLEVDKNVKHEDNEPSIPLAKRGRRHKAIETASIVEGRTSRNSKPPVEHSSLSTHKKLYSIDENMQDSISVPTNESKEFETIAKLVLDDSAEVENKQDNKALVSVGETVTAVFHNEEEQHSEEKKSSRKVLKHARAVSGSSQDSVVIEEPLRRRVRHIEQMTKVVEETYVSTEKIQTDKNVENIDKISTQKSTRRLVKDQGEQMGKSRRKRGRHEESEDIRVSENTGELKEMASEVLSEVHITEVKLQPEESVSNQQKSPIGKQSGVEEDHDILPFIKRRAATNDVELDDDKSGPSSKRRIGRRKAVAGEDDNEEKSTHSGTSDTTAIQRNVDRKEPKNAEEEPTHTESAISKRGNVGRKKHQPGQNHKERSSEKHGTEEKQIHTEGKRRNVGRKEKEFESDHDDTRSVISTDNKIEHQEKSGLNDEIKKGRGIKKRNADHEEKEQPSISLSPEVKYKRRKRKELHVESEDNSEEKSGEKIDVLNKDTEHQTPQSSGTVGRRGLKTSAIDKKTHEHITADDTPGRRARNVPQRRAATAYHNYDETSDNEKQTKTKKKIDSPRKSLEAAKSFPTAATIATVPLINLPLSQSSTTPVTTARGRTRKPTARIQQFLEEERAKAETPKKRALLAAIGGMSTPRRTPAKRMRKPLAIETDVEVTPRTTKSRGKGKHTNENEIAKTEAAIVVEEKEIEVHNTTPPASSNVAKGRRGGRKVKLVEEDHNTSEPPAKKSLVELEIVKSDLSPPIDSPTPSIRTTGKRNAAAAAKARIEEDALAAAAIDPPRRGKARKVPKIATESIPDTDDHSSEIDDIKENKNKSSSQKQDNLLKNTASTLKDNEDLAVVEDTVVTETLEKPTTKRGGTRKMAATSTTTSPAPPAKKDRKIRKVDVIDSETAVDAKATRGRGRRNVHQQTESSISTQENIESEPMAVETSEPIKRGTRTRRK